MTHISALHPLIAGTSAVSLPSSVDLRSGFPSPFDQGQLGSCTSNAFVGSAMYIAKKEGVTNPTMLSRLMLYWQERSYINTTGIDSGAYLSDGIRALHDVGVCPESMWPYADTGIQFTVRPTNQCFTEALKRRDLDQKTAASVAQNLSVIQNLINLHYPVTIGFLVYTSFESQTVARTGVVPMPNTSRERLLGGHAVVIAGYDNSKQVFIMRNSWGTNWGMQGYFTMPYNYVLNPKLTSDLWVIHSISDPLIRQ